jgi:hypothetical protein
MWQLSEADANDRLGSAAAAATTTTTHDARPRHGLLADARGLRRRTCATRFLAIGLTARLLAPRTRVLLVFVLARGGRRRAFRFFIGLPVGNAGLAPERLAARAFDRADAAGMLGKFRNQLGRHADIVGRLTSDRQIPAKRSAGRGGQLSVGLAAEAAEPGQFGLRRANQLWRIGLLGGPLGGLGRKIIERRNDRSAEPVTRQILGEGFQVLDT